MRFALIPLTLVLAAAAQAQQPITTARHVVEAMRARYDGKWYRTLTFVQHNTQHLPDGAQQRSVWREFLQFPGKLRVEVEPADSGGGMLFTNDSQYVFRHDSTVLARPFVHPLMVLGFDVYMNPIEKTLRDLEAKGFNLSVLSEATWENRPVWVVGAPAGDLRTRQFWVDKERLVFVRLLEPAPRDSASVAETRFSKYAPLAGGWIAPEVEFLLNGQRVFFEEYREVQTNVAIPPGRWDARQWKAARQRR